MPSAYPAPLTPEGIDATSVTYPGPEVPAVPGVTYPGPEDTPATGLAEEPYPMTGSEVSPTTRAMPTATLQGAYPPPEGTQEPGSGPYPGPGSDQSLVTPGSGPQPTFAPGVPTEESTPTTTPTLGLLRTELVASDPKSFRLASGEYQLVEFFAFWSPESQSMAPVMNVLEQRNSDRVQFVYLDIDDPANSLFKTLLANRLPPVFFLLDGSGNILHEWQGYIELDAFETTIAELVP
jgi:thiol-disulfide isomerase/thioredoxin